MKWELVWLVLGFGFVAADTVGPDPLELAWRSFVDVQKNQTANFGRDFPVDDRLLSSLRKCGSPAAGQKPTAIHDLSFRDIELYAEIGHLTTFCRPGITLTQHPNDTVDLAAALETFRRSCLSSMSTQSSKPSISKLLRLMGAQKLELFESNFAHPNLQTWTRHIVRMIKRTQNHEDRWKLFLMAPGLFDVGIGGEFGSLSDDVLQSIQIIQSELPLKTVILLVKNSEVTIFREIAKSFSFCEKILSFWEFEKDQSAANWLTLVWRIKRNYQTDLFHIHVLDIIDGAVPVMFNEMPDVSILDSDCLHLSDRGLAILHGHIWNWITQPAKQTLWKPVVRPLYCPRPECPFIVTNRNSLFCHKTFDSSTQRQRFRNSLIVVFVFVVIALYITITIYSLCL